MAKIDVETLKFILQRKEPDIRKVNDILQAVQQELQAEEEEKANKPPAVKKQFGIIVADAEGVLNGKDLVGWVIQIPEEDAIQTGPDRIIKAAYDYNATPKGRRSPVQTLGEACEAVGAKFLKEHQVFVKTKVPVLVVARPNKIPTE